MKEARGERRMKKEESGSHMRRGRMSTLKGHFNKFDHLNNLSHSRN